MRAIITVTGKDAVGIIAQVSATCTEANANITSYYKQARAEFCTGVRDPKSDADWQTYLNDLDDLRYHEDWIGPAQTSWDMDKAAK